MHVKATALAIGNIAKVTGSGDISGMGKMIGGDTGSHLVLVALLRPIHLSLDHVFILTKQSVARHYEHRSDPSMTRKTQSSLA